ncbi:MAG TPA: FAD-binding oxidoreductase [Solirubrobacteraceae bacterium]|nr:FAD-binding oxidoreductase [Solirubrobacteraceae bacterium]
MGTLSSVRPETFAEAARVLSEATAEGRAVRICGAGTKPWTPPVRDGGLPLRTSGLNRILAHDPGDMTATLEAGVPLREAQARFAAEDQMLALDPPADGATIGGIVATGDCGPLEHRYGGPRDLVVGMTVALADGTIARSGGTVIKNVAGYDIAKLFCGGFGTLGLILSVNLRLHPRLPTVTALGESDDAARLCAAARALAAMPAELESLDLAWSGGAGRVLARCAGPQAQPRAERLCGAMSGELGLEGARTEADDATLWEAQRAAQRSVDAAVVRVAALPTAAPAVIAAAEAERGTLVARAALGHAYVTLAPDRVSAFRERLPAGAVSVLRDCPPDARARVADPWGATPERSLALMRALKERFDPTGTCNPATFVGGI